jgi:hypothetical protein
MAKVELSALFLKDGKQKSAADVGVASVDDPTPRASPGR